LIRVDASVEIGTGHVYRCLALADELKRRGWLALFATRVMPEMLRATVRGRGHQILDSPPEPDGTREALVLKGQLPPSGVDATVVDHYGVGAPWHTEARNWSRVVAAIDDLATSPLDVDLVVNQNLGTPGDAYRHLVPPRCVSLIGPQFAILRPEFPALRRGGPRLRQHVDRLLIFMSGADEHNVTGIAVRAVTGLGLPADVVVGAAYPHMDMLEAQAQANPRLVLHRHTEGMATLMNGADLSIGAPSGASWERCCLGLPTILISLADNQLPASAALAKSGSAIDLGWFREVLAEDIQQAVERLIGEPRRVKAMSQAAAKITDGRGAARVASTLETLLAELGGG
jgi:UDP-2,4-diacetamido-2,4,6-trideoxy-beta-L-altropyranose hydrolase